MTQDRIIEAVLAFIAADGATEQEFNGLALDLFAYQFENNAPFRRFALQRERTPKTARRLAWDSVEGGVVTGYTRLAELTSRPGSDAQVAVEGMAVVDQLYGGYGEGAPSGAGPDQNRLQSEGNAYLESDFPELDYIERATIVGS